MLRRLGEELITNVDQGIVELVRNAYDADAHQCTIELINTDIAGGTLRLVDDGEGMDDTAIKQGWLVLGKSSKAVRRPTRLKRLPVGEKGLGRLAALRLGDRAVLRTRPIELPNVEYQLVLDWTKFDDAPTVEDVPLEIERAATGEDHGTTVEVSGLHVKFAERDVERLARSLVLLSDPFQETLGFRAVLVAPQFQDLERRVRDAYFEEAEFFLEAEVNEFGTASATVTGQRQEVLWAADHSSLTTKSRNGEPYLCPSAKFQLWVFILDSQRFAARDVTKGEVREWLNVVGGVHLYHRGLRVHPYGDPGHDWLEMNLARVRNPELRPSTNTSLGRVIVTDPHEKLIPKTDRTGFIENEAFEDLRRFAQDALEWMADRRLAERESRRQEQKQTATDRSAKAKEAVASAVRKVPRKSRRSVQRALNELQRAQTEEVKALREDLQLYRTLSTVGTTTAVFAHEAAKPVTQIEKMIGVVATKAEAALGVRYQSTVGRPVEYIRRASSALKTFAALPIRLLRRSKRRITDVDVHEVVGNILELFNPYLSDAAIEVDRQLTDQKAIVRGSEAALEAVLANMITNAVNAFNRSGRIGERRLIIRTEMLGHTLLLRVLDNGPGISRIAVEEIWLPGKSTFPGGTGLGLTIVRDAVIDLGGEVTAVPKGELGGAEFLVTLPARG
jgi:signal transduction histidine kinase